MFGAEDFAHNILVTRGGREIIRGCEEG